MDAHERRSRDRLHITSRSKNGALFSLNRRPTSGRAYRIYRQALRLLVPDLPESRRIFSTTTEGASTPSEWCGLTMDDIAADFANPNAFSVSAQGDDGGVSGPIGHS